MNFCHQQKNDVLLFQIDSDDAANWNFGDANAVRIYLSPAALAQRDFKRARITPDEE